MVALGLGSWMSVPLALLGLRLMVALNLPLDANNLGCSALDALGLVGKFLTMLFGGVFHVLDRGAHRLQLLLDSLHTRKQGVDDVLENLALFKIDNGPHNGYSGSGFASSSSRAITEGLEKSWPAEPELSRRSRFSTREEARPGVCTSFGLA